MLVVGFRMRFQGGDSDRLIVFQIGSVEALMVPTHGTFAYSSSKVRWYLGMLAVHLDLFDFQAALHHLSCNLAGHLGWDGITSNTIACGE